MSYIVLQFNKQAREKLASGCQQLADAVVCTLGPRSWNVAINQSYPGPRVIHDGVTVARNIKLKDRFEDMGASLLREAASKTNDIAGDGTTTATLLANTLVQKGMVLVDSRLDNGVILPKTDAMLLKEELNRYAEQTIKELDEIAVQIKDDDISRIASISASNSEIGELIADGFKKIGSDGLIVVQEGVDVVTTLEVEEGMSWDNGYLSPQFSTNDRQIAQYSGGGHYVLVTDQTIQDAEALVNIIIKVSEAGKSKKALLVVANDVINPALFALVVTKLKTGVPLVAVMAPEFGERRKESLEDIAALTGGVVVSADKGMRLQDVKLQDLGRLKSLEVSQTHTTIVPDNPDTEEITERCESIKEQIKTEENPVRKERLKVRLARLSQGVATIYVGGASKTEVDERKERVIDAVHATKAAIAEGVIPGGGVALFWIAEKLARLKEVQHPHIHDLVIETLRSPLRRLIENSGESPDPIEMKLIDRNVSKYGYDVVSKQVVDMLQAGIIDPVKVTKSAVRHAFSVAGMILTTACLISQERETDVQKIKVVQEEV